MSVMFSTSLTSYPRSASHCRIHIETTNGRAFPMWIRWYTVGPQTYMRIGPGGAGSSTFCRVDES